MRKLVVLESPYGSNVIEDLFNNIAYAKEAVCDSLSRGEAPIAFHLFYTQEGILNDSIATERQQGIEAGKAWLQVAEACVVYVDRGISLGMAYGIVAAVEAGLSIEFRQIEKD